MVRVGDEGEQKVPSFNYRSNITADLDFAPKRGRTPRIDVLVTVFVGVGVRIGTRSASTSQMLADALLENFGGDEFNSFIIDRLNVIIGNKARFKSRLRFLILDVIDLHKSNWVKK